MTTDARSRFLPRAAIILGLVSLLNDLAGEMLAPVIPLFLTMTLGAGPAAVGLVEGLAQACASLLKLASGIAVDRGVKPKSLMLGGYGLASTARPLIGLATGWTSVLVLRTLDRVGKGIRGTPRDALLAASVSSQRLGRAFGFHRAMDYLGSGLGPAVGAIALALGVSMRGLFALAVIPGVLVLAMIAFGVEDRRLTSTNSAKRPLSWKQLPGRLRGLLLACALLAVTSVHDAFLVLWINERLEGNLRDVLLLFAAVNIVRAIVAMFGGELTDRIGTLPTIVIGWLSRIGLLVMMAVAPGPLSASHASMLVIALTATMAWSGPAELTLLTRGAPDGNRGAVLGTYHMLTGLMMLPGAAAFGLLWQQLGANVALLTAAAGSALAALTLVLFSFMPAGGAHE